MNQHSTWPDTKDVQFTHPWCTSHGLLQDPWNDPHAVRVYVLWRVPAVLLGIIVTAVHTAVTCNG
jgi:hypothetical protein